MNWSALTKKQQQMAIATIVLAVFQIVILTYFLRGRAGNGSDGSLSSKEELQQLETKIQDARLVIAREQRVKDALEESVKELEELSRYVPTSSDRYAWAYEYISLRAAKAGIELDSLEEVTPMILEEGDAETLPYEIRISTRCGYNRLVEFLWRIEKSNPLLRVKTVEIMSRLETASLHQVKIVVQWPAPLDIDQGNLPASEEAAGEPSVMDGSPF